MSLAHESYAPLRGRLVTPVTVILALLTLPAAWFLLQRFIYGMGAVSNLNNGQAWGIWIVFDVLIGTAFACGGYALALLVYIFNRQEYHPLMRPAVTASMLGYALGGAAVIVDLGRWWNFWHLLWPGYANVNSVMFEVGVCITIYIFILMLEFAPIALERFGLMKWRNLLRKVMFAIIALGVLLPSMHQSSLGSMLIVMGGQVHPLYQTVLLPLLYVLSALAMGYAVVIFEGTISGEGFRLPRETPLLAKVGRVLAWVVLAWLVIRFADLAWRGVLPLAFQPGRVSTMFWIEIALYSMAVLILFIPALRKIPCMLFIAATSMLAAASLYRIDSYFVAYNPGDQIHYFPSIPEMSITIGIASFEILAFIILVRLFPVFPAHGKSKAA